MVNKKYTKINILITNFGRSKEKVLYHYLITKNNFMQLISFLPFNFFFLKKIQATLDF
jgi:hypothetical protein